MCFQPHSSGQQNTLLQGDEELKRLYPGWCRFSHSTAVCGTGLVWVGEQRERGMNKEKGHMQGHIFLNKFFLCFLLSKQNKRKMIGKKNHTVTQKQKNPTQDQSFLQQNQLLETIRKCHFQYKYSTSLSSFPCLSNSWCQQSSAQPHRQEQAQEGRCQ